MKDIKTIPGVTEQLQQFNIWEQDFRGHLAHFLFTGTREECEKEFVDMEYSEPQQQICENNVLDQVENEDKNQGYIEFGSGHTIWYNL